MDEGVITNTGIMGVRLIYLTTGFFAIANLLILVTAIPMHHVRFGTDAVIPLSLTIEPDSTLSYELVSIRQRDAFYRNGQMHYEWLEPSQRMRFNVSTSSEGDKFTVAVTIQDVQAVDEGVYVMYVRQCYTDGSCSSHVVDVLIKVLLPPGPATCTITESPYTNSLRLVGCQATLSTDGGGLLVCYQNGMKVPYLGEIEHTSTHVRGIFWMDITEAINCCSYEANGIKDHSSCMDFSADLNEQTERPEPSSVTTLATATSKHLSSVDTALALPIPNAIGASNRIVQSSVIQISTLGMVLLAFFFI